MRKKKKLFQAQIQIYESRNKLRVTTRKTQLRESANVFATKGPKKDLVALHLDSPNNISNSK